MSARTVLLILLAIVTAGGTALYARNWLNAERAGLLASAPGEQTVAPAKMVLVAKEDLAAGSFVRNENLKWQAWPEDGVQETYAVKGERKMEDFTGSVVRSKIVMGEPLTESRVVQPGDRGFLAAVLEPGKRAVSVPVNATTGISGFVFPGDWVDVILTGRFKIKKTDGKKNTQDDHAFSETLLSDIRVLAVDQAVENAEGKVSVAKTATLEVDPKQAEKIAIGIEMGNLSLSLHSLARDQDDFAQLARSVGADPVEKAETRSYTIDQEIYFMREKMLKGTRGAPGQRVNVLRGSAAAAAAF